MSNRAFGMAQVVALSLFYRSFLVFHVSQGEHLAIEKTPTGRMISFGLQKCIGCGLIGQ
jgi:hypothetical protein